MKKIIVIVSIFLSLSCAWAQELSSAPDFGLSDMRGNIVSMSSYKDKQAVILFFWTTWCPFCRDELILLKDKYPQLKKDDMELLTVNIEEADYKVDNFIKNYGLTFKVLLDKDAAVAYSYRIIGVPTYIIINKKGDIRFKGNYFPEEEYKKLVSE